MEVEAVPELVDDRPIGRKRNRFSLGVCSRKLRRVPNSSFTYPRSCRCPSWRSTLLPLRCVQPHHVVQHEHQRHFHLHILESPAHATDELQISFRMPVRGFRGVRLSMHSRTTCWSWSARRGVDTLIIFWRSAGCRGSCRPISRERITGKCALKSLPATSRTLSVCLGKSRYTSSRGACAAWPTLRAASLRTPR